MRGPLDGPSMGPTHTDGGYLPVPWTRTGPPEHPPPPTGSGCHQSKHAFSAGSALPAGKRASDFPSLLAGRSSKTVPRRRVSDLAALAGTVQGSWSSSGPGAVPGSSSAELLASHLRRIADSARLTPPPDLRLPRQYVRSITLGRPLNRISVQRRTGGSPSTYVLVWQHGPVTISGQGLGGHRAPHRLSRCRIRPTHRCLSFCTVTTIHDAEVARLTRLVAERRRGRWRDVDLRQNMRGGGIARGASHGQHRRLYDHNLR